MAGDSWLGGTSSEDAAQRVGRADEKEPYLLAKLVMFALELLTLNLEAGAVAASRSSALLDHLIEPRLGGCREPLELILTRGGSSQERAVESRVELTEEARLVAAELEGVRGGFGFGVACGF